MDWPGSARMTSAIAFATWRGVGLRTAISPVRLWARCRAGPLAVRPVVPVADLGVGRVAPAVVLVVRVAADSVVDAAAEDLGGVVVSAASVDSADKTQTP